MRATRKTTIMWFTAMCYTAMLVMGVDQNHFYDNGVYTNGGHGNAKYSKPYRGVCRNGTRKTAIYTDGVHSKVYHHKPENKSGGYINNDLYMPHCTGRHKPTTTSNDQMEISDGSTWPRKQVTARYAEGDARYFPSRGRGW